MKFKAGDLVRCISVDGLGNPKIVVGEIYTVSYLDGQYIHIKDIHIKDKSVPRGGFFSSRFVLSQIMDATEYEDIMAGQEIYSELEGSNGR